MTGMYHVTVLLVRTGHDAEHQALREGWGGRGGGREGNGVGEVREEGGGRGGVVGGGMGGEGRGEEEGERGRMGVCEEMRGGIACLACVCDV